MFLFACIAPLSDDKRLNIVLKMYYYHRCFNVPAYVYLLIVNNVMKCVVLYMHTIDIIRKYPNTV